MIEKIQNLIEDNTSMEVTRKQVIMGVTLVGLLGALIIFFMFGTGGPKKESATQIVSPPNLNAPMHIQGQ